MTPELKFRAWSYKDKLMYNVDTIIFPVGGIKWYGPGVGEGIVYVNQKYNWKVDSVLMQFTGLLDINGKEIYDGDIVQYYVRKTRKIGRIAWGSVSWWLVGELDKLNYISHWKIEVIGNVYENPELLP